MPWALALAAFAAVSLSSAISGGAEPRQDTEKALKRARKVKPRSKGVAAAVDAASKALKRADSARAAEGRDRARLLETLASRWAEVATDLLRALQAEQKAAAAQKRAAKVQAETVRMQALIEETLARRNRAERRLQQLQQKADSEGAPSSKATEPAGENHP